MITKKVNSAFARRQYAAQVKILYNRINKIIDIYQNTSIQCKKKLIIWLKTLNYEEIEDLLY